MINPFDNLPPSLLDVIDAHAVLLELARSSLVRYMQKESWVCVRVRQQLDNKESTLNSDQVCVIVVSSLKEVDRVNRTYECLPSIATLGQWPRTRSSPTTAKRITPSSLV